MKLWKIMAVSALVFSGSALANDFFGSGGGSPTPVFQTTNWNSEMQIYQHGSNNLANASQDHAQKSLTAIEQHGKANVAATLQTGDKSLLDIKQYGSNNYADATQSGDKSKLLISQNGHANFVTSNQSASGSLVNVVQVGSGNKAFAQQH